MCVFVICYQTRKAIHLSELGIVVIMVVTNTN